jgi:hypothetical protein
MKDHHIRQVWWDRWYSWIVIGGPPGRWIVGIVLGLRIIRGSSSEWHQLGDMIRYPSISLIVIAGSGTLLACFTIVCFKYFLCIKTDLRGSRYWYLLPLMTYSRVGRHWMQLRNEPGPEKEPWSGYHGEKPTEMKTVGQWLRPMLISTTQVPEATGQPYGIVTSWFGVVPAGT